jgi:hypothetical protein
MNINESKLRSYHKSYLYTLTDGKTTYFGKIYDFTYATSLYIIRNELHTELPKSMKKYIPKPIGLFKLKRGRFLILTEFVQNSITLKEFLLTSTKSKIDTFVKKLKNLFKEIIKLGFTYNFSNSTNIRVVGTNPLLVDLEFLEEYNTNNSLMSNNSMHNNEWFKFLQTTNGVSQCKKQLNLFNTKIKNKKNILLK